jgi:hypothetical protein
VASLGESKRCDAEEEALGKLELLVVAIGQHDRDPDISQAAADIGLLLLTRSKTIDANEVGALSSQIQTMEVCNYLQSDDPSIRGFGGELISFMVLSMILSEINAL